MNTLAIITKIELKKLFQRKDSWLMFTILLVPILYSVGLASNSDVITYTGAGNITAIGFASAMFQMSQSMFIFNVILSAIVGRSLASEIENKSIRLYVNRIGVRKLIYGGKELALLIFSVFIDILLVLTSIAFYYAVLIHNPKVASLSNLKQYIASYMPLSPLIEEYANAVEGKREIQAGNSFRGLLTALGELLNSFKELIVDGICWFPRLMRWQTSKGEVAPVFSDYRNEGYNYRLVAYQNLVTKEQYSVESVQEEIKAENRVGTLEQLERRIEETEVLVRKLHKDKMR